jgi:hypothetical protein
VTVVQEADARAAVGGATVRFSVRMVDDGDDAVHVAGLVDDLRDVVDDADYNDDARPTQGAVTYSGGQLRWRGDVPGHGAVTLGFSVTVRCTGGNRALVNRVGGTVVTVPVLDLS